jgi:hypothetical protein
MKKLFFLLAFIFSVIFVASSVCQTTKVEQNLVWVSEKGEKYHLKSCRYVKSNFYSIDRDEAIKQGYEPCKVCKPDQSIK